MQRLSERLGGVFVNNNNKVAEMKAAFGDFDYLTQLVNHSKHST
jgi:hypothetical protein